MYLAYILPQVAMYFSMLLLFNLVLVIFMLMGVVGLGRVYKYGRCIGLFSIILCFVDLYLSAYVYLWGPLYDYGLHDLWELLKDIGNHLYAAPPLMYEEFMEISFEWKMFHLAVLSLALLIDVYLAFTKIVLVKPTARLSADFVPESMQPGSEFEMRAKMPSFQVEIYGSNGDKYYPLGQGCNVTQGIITAAHVVYDVDRIALVRGEERIVVSRDDFEFLEGDLALYRLSQCQQAKLGLTRAKLSRQSVVGTTGLMAQVVAFGSRSFGFITEYPQYGFCTYGGSTVKGFSGAPYYMNNTVFGIHVGGNGTNLGYESGYVHSLLNPSKTVVPHAESSDEWLIEQAHRTSDFHYERSPYDPDEYRVRLNGRYHIVDSSVLQQMSSKTKAKKKATIAMELESKPMPAIEKETFKDVIYQPPKESDLPKMPVGALEFQDQGNYFRAPAVVAGATGVRSIPRRSAAFPARPTSNTTASSCPMPLEKSHMESLTSTPAQPKEASPSTQRSKNQKARSRRQQNARDAELWRKHVALMGSGQ